MLTPPHSGECIHDPQWEGMWDAIIIAPGAMADTNDYPITGSAAYTIVTGYQGGSGLCYVCHTCIKTPGYFNDYLLYKLNQLTSLEEVLKYDRS